MTEGWILMYATLKPKQILIFNKFEYHRGLVNNLNRLKFYAKSNNKDNNHAFKAYNNLAFKILRQEQILKGLMVNIDAERFNIMDLRFFKNMHISHITRDYNYKSKSLVVHKIRTTLQDLSDYTMRIGGDFSLWQI